VAIFGLPGGSELLVIGGVVLLLFFPGALLVWIGWVLGRRSVGPGGGSRDGAAAPQEPGSDATQDTGRDTDDIAESDHGD
jgi:hypothetical protein